jgi:hypothetical protein
MKKKCSIGKDPTLSGPTTVCVSGNAASAAFAEAREDRFIRVVSFIRFCQVDSRRGAIYTRRSAIYTRRRGSEARLVIEEVAAS